MSQSFIYASGVLVGALVTRFHSLEGAVWIAIVFGTIGLGVSIQKLRQSEV